MDRYKLVILGLLNEKAMHGYQMDQVIKHRSMNVWAKVNMASIYNTLTSLEKSGEITVKKKKVGNMPERKIYYITAKGKLQLAALVEKGLSKIKKGNNVEFLLSVAFIPVISREKAKQALKKRVNNIKQMTKILKEIHAKHENIIPFNWIYIIDSALNHVNVELNGTNCLIKRLDKSQS